MNEDESYTKSEILERLEILVQHGHIVDFQEDMSIDRLIVIYNDMIDEIQRKNNERAEKGRLSFLILTLISQNVIPTAEGIRLMKSDMANHELAAEIAKYDPLKD